jgi:polyhydroxyalkanoate synthesis regulator phasin
MSHQLDKYDILMKVLEIIEQEQAGYLTAEQAGVFVEKFTGILVQQQTHIEKVEGDNIMGNKPTGEQKIEVLLENATIYGDFAVAHSIKDSFNKITASAVSNELKELIKELAVAVGKMTQEMPKEQAEDVAEDLKNLVEQATREKPKRKWWSVSVAGLTQAAKNIGKIGEPVMDILERTVPLLIKVSV